ncbi:hypothetical protein CRUP_020939 [Coryphaenoides rupestris]|nr:hypothetical protein CRUP_020939 [Coryphaenoides rupestris]
MDGLFYALPQGQMDLLFNQPKQTFPSLRLSLLGPHVTGPLLDSNTLLQAWAHIQTRLGSYEMDRNGNGRKSSMPAPPPHILPRTPKLLAPLDSHTKGPMSVPQLHYPRPLKPIRGTPRRNIRRDCLGSCPSSPRGGSEESGSSSSSSSSSSQSSIDLEDEVEEVEREFLSTYFHEAEAISRDREPTSARQPRRAPVAVARPRSKSAMGFTFTYKDTFQTIQSRDDGVAIDEMFAGLMCDNLTTSSSCDKSKEGAVPVSTPSRKSHHTFKGKKQPFNKPLENRKLRRSPVEKMKFLDEVGEGPMTDELLKCLAEELISLDETETSVCLCPPNRQSVFCALTNQGKLIAVKQVSLDMSEPKAADREYSRLQEEVELLKTLNHGNIVGFLGTSLRQHIIYIFMEYVPGGSIASVLHRFGPLPERVLSLYSHQILEGVAYLHQNRVIHRDLKGNNIMLMPTGVVKLIDFGCARRLSHINHTGSQSGDLIKSVINESGYGRKSDIWSVGCTVFEMATGKPPLAHMDKMAALFYIGAQRGSMPLLPDGFSHHAKDFVNICLTSDQKLRPTADQLLKHSFIPSKSRENSPETQRRPCCASRPDGLCYR